MKLIIFDCDGTLVDGQHLILEAMSAASRVCDVAYAGDEAVRQIVGLSLGEAIEICYPRETAATHMAIKQAFIARFQELRQENKTPEPLFDGVRDMIEHLHRADFMLGVATGKSRRGLEITLTNHGLRDYFVTLNTADDGPGKPHPAMLENAMRDVGVDAAQTLMIGDTSFDMVMARAANVRSVGVTWGYHETQILQEAGADHMIDHISQLKKILP